MSSEIVKYKVVEIPESGSQSTLNLSVTIKQGYENLKHVNKVNNETFDNSRRDLFTADISHDHPDENLRGKKVYLKKINLNKKNQLQCWREMMIGLEIKHDLSTRIVDNWIEIQDGKPANAYYATVDNGGVSLKQALRTKGKLKRLQKQKAPISFFQFAKIAQDLITTLIILKKNAVLHRDIIINNVLVYDLEGKDEKNPGPRTELIDYGWAKKIVNATDTCNVGTAGKIAPELSLKSKDYNSLITSKPYSHPVDIFATGQLLAEIIELDKGFFKTFSNILGFTQCGNTWIDESFGSTMFGLLAEKADGSFSPMNTPTEKQKEAMINVNEGTIMPDPEPYKTRLNKFINTNRKGKLVKSDSLSQRYLRNFWFRYLDPSKGWTPERIDMTVDLIMKMLNYWPDDRPTPEELYKHEIFQEKDDEGKLILPPRDDVEGIDNMVRLSNDEQFQSFQGKLANADSKLFMKTESSMNRLDEGQQNGSNTTIHTIVTLEEKIDIGSNVRLKASDLIDKVGSNEAARDNLSGLGNLKDLGNFLKQGGVEIDTGKSEEEEQYKTALERLQISGAANIDEWGNRNTHVFEDRKEVDQDPDNMY